jgi:hypothetical protein
MALPILPQSRSPQRRGPWILVFRNASGFLVATIGFGNCRMTWRRAGADAANRIRHRRGRGFSLLEGNMCGTAMRGVDALPGSKATSRAKGTHRNLGDSRVWPPLSSGYRVRRSASGRRGAEADDVRRGKSDSAIVCAGQRPEVRGWGHHYKRAHVRKLFHQLDG